MPTAGPLRGLAAALLLVCACGCGGPAPGGRSDPHADPDAGRIRAATEAVRPLHVRLSAPEPGDWLDQFPERPQTFDQYLETGPTTARGERRVLYVEPLGDFSPARRRIVDLAAEFMGDYFGLKVVVRPGRSLATVPSFARRAGDSAGEQIHSGYVLEKMLLPDLPEDAAARIALTSADLYPEDSWNFVFGQANLRERVGVWSLARFGDPEEGGEAFRLCLLRTLKVATHETGHMFSLPHCALYACSMNGSNSLPETDRHPLDLCPECTAKLCWATGADPAERLRRMAAFCDANGLLVEQVAAERSLRALVAAGLAARDAGPAPPGPEAAAALREIEAQHHVQEAALGRLDFASYSATLDEDFTIRLSNGVLVAHKDAFALARDTFKLMRQVRRVTLGVESFGVDGDRAVAFVRHEFDKTAVGNDGLPRRSAGAVIQREVWVRTPSGWRLRSLEEGGYEGLSVDGA